MKTLKKIVLSLLITVGISSVNLNSMIVNGFLNGTGVSAELVRAAGFSIDKYNRVHGASGRFISGLNIVRELEEEQEQVESTLEFSEEEGAVTVYHDNTDFIFERVIVFLEEHFVNAGQDIDNLNRNIENAALDLETLINDVARLRTELNELRRLIGNLNDQFAIAYAECNNRLAVAENRISEIIREQDVIRQPNFLERNVFPVADMVSNFSDRFYVTDACLNGYEKVQELHPLERIKTIVDNINFRRVGVMSVEILSGGIAIIRLASSAVGMPVMVIEQITELLALAGITTYEIIRQ